VENLKQVGLGQCIDSQRSGMRYALFSEIIMCRMLVLTRLALVVSLSCHRMSRECGPSFLFTRNMCLSFYSLRNLKASLMARALCVNRFTSMSKVGEMETRVVEEVICIQREHFCDQQTVHRFSKVGHCSVKDFHIP
jgi:hypothetical protein